MFMRRSFSTLSSLSSLSSSSFKMSTYTTDKASPFTRAVVRAMRRLYVLSIIYRSGCFVFVFVLFCGVWVGQKLMMCFCLHLGIRRSWLIVVLIILGVSLMVILWGLCNADGIFKCFLKRRLILSDGR